MPGTGPAASLWTGPAGTAPAASPRTAPAGPGDRHRLPVAAFNLEGVPHGLLAARLADEYAIGTRSGCFCAHPYTGRLLGLSDAEVDRFHADVRAGARHRLPGAVRVGANRQTHLTDISLLGQALREIAADPEGAERYPLDERDDHVPRVQPRLRASV